MAAGVNAAGVNVAGDNVAGDMAAGDMAAGDRPSDAVASIESVVLTSGQVSSRELPANVAGRSVSTGEAAPNASPAAATQRSPMRGDVGR